MMTSSNDDKTGARSDGGPAAVTVRALTVRKGKKEVLHGIDLKLRPGSITGLFGPSGCGKTTLMRSIVGVQKIHSGTITVLGAQPGAKALRSEVGYVTQAAAVYRDLTLEQNVRYFARLYGAGAERVRETIEAAGLTEQTEQKVQSMSGGQASRASLACALVADPKFLVLDEPTVGLDPVTREELWGHFRGVAERGTTILVSSHVMDEAGHCDRLVLMRHGVILQDTDPAELLEATGTSTYDQAFLSVITEGVAA